jgi:F-type H+-transporting ATPase subunit delta
MTANHSVVAEHYADAVMQLAANTGADKEVLDNLKAINEVITATPDFEVLLKHPAVAAQDKKNLIKKVFGGRIHELTLRLLELLTDRRRMEILGAIETEYEELWQARHNIVAGTLAYADKPDARMTEQVKGLLQKKLGKTIELTELEDKTLIGGYVLRLADQVIDGSLKGRLQAIEKQLLSV